MKEIRGLMKQIRGWLLMLAMAFMILIFVAPFVFAQAPAISPVPKKAAPDFATLASGLPINLNGDTAFRVRANSFDGGVGIDLASYKGLVTLRAEITQSAQASPFAGAGLMLNIPTLLNKIAGANWQAGAINPSIGIVPGYDFGQQRFDIGVILSIVSVSF